jgi:hypothetical protein
MRAVAHLSLPWISRLALAPPRRRPHRESTNTTVDHCSPCHYAAAMKATSLIAAVAAALGCAAPATAFPPYPVPFMEHDGTYQVGKDIRPGLYLTLGGFGSETCSWTRLASTTSRDVSSVIDRGESRDAQYAQIAPTDAAFETHGCQAWRIGPRPATPIAPPGRTCIYPLTGCVDPSASAPSP